MSQDAPPTIVFEEAVVAAAYTGRLDLAEEEVRKAVRAMEDPRRLPDLAKWWKALYPRLPPQTVNLESVEIARIISDAHLACWATLTGQGEQQIDKQIPTRAKEAIPIPDPHYRWALWTATNAAILRHHQTSSQKEGDYP